MKTKQFNTLLGLAFLLALPVSCNKYQDSSIPDGLIVFKTDPSFTAMVETTKATVVDQASLGQSGFKVSATTGGSSETEVWTNIQFNKSDNVFKATESKWWPSSDPSYHFYASTQALTYTAAGATVSASNANDVVCAYLPSSTYKSANTLPFKHIFARIGDVTFQAVNGYTITGISLNITPKTGGTYNLRTGVDKTDGTGWSSLTDGTSTNLCNSTPGTKSNDLYLVPGHYTITAGWTATKGNYTETFSNKTFSVDIVGGAVNNLTASLTGNATELTFSVSVNAWGTNNIPIGTYPY